MIPAWFFPVLILFITPELARGSFDHSKNSILAKYPTQYWLLWASDFAISVSYLTIAGSIAYIYVKRKERPHFFWIYAVILLLTLCGVARFAMLWIPTYMAASVAVALRILNCAGFVLIACSIACFVPHAIRMPTIQELQNEITVRKKTELNLEQKVAKIQAIQYLIAETMLSPGTEKLSEAAAETLRIFFGASRCIFQVYDRSEGQVLGAAISSSDSCTFVHGPVIHPDLALLIQADQAVSMHRIEGSPLFLASRDCADAKSALAASASYSDFLAGIVLVEQHTFPRFWTDEDKEDLQTVANQLAIALTQAHLLDTTKETAALYAEQKSQLLIQNEELQRARDTADKANQSKTRFLNTMSHEIRTPLNAVIGFSSLLSHTDLSAEQNQYVDAIRVSGNNLLALIGDILDFSKLGAGKLELDRAPFSLRRLLEESLDMLSSAATAKQLDLYYCTTPDVPECLFGDVLRIQQILVNLLSNACKFTQDGEVTISCSCEKTEESHVNVTFLVKDTGIGISMEKRGLLFEAFSQADSTISRRYGGTGLGLAISKKLVSVMGGHVWMEPNIPRGSIFGFSLPLQASQLPFPDAHRDSFQYEPSDGVTLRPLFQKSILCISPNQTFLSQVSRWLLLWDAQPICLLDADGAFSPVTSEDPFSADCHAAIIDYRTYGNLQQGSNIPAAVSDRLKQLPTVVIAPIGLNVLMAAPTGQRPMVVTVPVKYNALKEALYRLMCSSPLPNGKNDLGPAPLAEALSASPKPEDPGIRILMAEDNEMNQKLGKRMLRVLGHGCDIVGNGRECVEAVRRETYDLIFMDVMMPDMDGLQATRTIRSEPLRHPGPWIVALTANVDEDMKKACVDAGMNDYVQKPYKIANIKQAIQRFIAARCRLPS